MFDVVVDVDSCDVVLLAFMLPMLLLVWFLLMLV